MADYRDLLVSKAFSVFAGAEYNRWLADLNSGSGRLKDAVMYEVSLLEEKPWAYMRDQVYPAFARFLKHKSLDPEDPERVVVAVFLKGRCFLLEGKKFMDVFQEMEGLNSSALHFRILRWFSE